MTSLPFEPGFLIFVNTDVDDGDFREWFFRVHASIGVIPATPALGRLGLNYIELTENNSFDPALFDIEDGFLYYPYFIAVYRNKPFPDEEVLIAEQVTLCRHLVHNIEQQSWKYGINGEVEKYL
jgi:hypothetical protein